MPENIAQDLRADHPRFVELQKRYQSFDSPVSVHTYWATHQSAESIKLHYFRGDNAYIWQYQRIHQDNRTKYYLFARYVADLDTRNLLGSELVEDGQFGCFTYEYDNLPTISRDLLDSVNEIYFLDRNWNLFARENVRILDIGAGYGRLAHRMLSACDNIDRYYCIDAIARSTYLCEYYLKYRGLTGSDSSKASVVPLDEMYSGVPGDGIDLAINIHSFSEMCEEAVAGWIDYINDRNIEWLFVVPNEKNMLTFEENGTRGEFKSIIEAKGFKQVCCEPTIRDADVADLFGVRDFFFLFRKEPSRENEAEPAAR